jgi:quercetin dioxygenase-like cupin family protein
MTKTEIANDLYQFIPNLTDLMAEITPDSIISRTIYKDKTVKAVLFGFDAGQSLSEHRAAQPAIIHVLSGDATITLGDAVHQATTGTWVYMTPQLAHSVVAKTPFIMLLLLYQKEG